MRGRNLAACAAAGCGAQGQVVGGVQRAGTERARRSAEHQQPEHRGVLPELHGGARAGAGGEVAVLSDADDGPVVLAAATPGTLRSAVATTTSSTSTGSTAVAARAGRRRPNSLPFDVSWEPDLWGKVRNTVREYQICHAGECGRARERAADRAGGAGGILFPAARDRMRCRICTTRRSRPIRNRWS